MGRSVRDGAGTPAARPQMAALRRAVYEFLAADGRLRARSQGLGRMSPPGGLEGLIRLMTEDEMTPTQLARAWARSPATVSEHLERLEYEGLVERRRDRTDRRVVRVSLTPKGRTQVAALRDEWDEQFHRVLESASDEDLVAASDVLQRLAGLFDGLAETEQHEGRA